MNDDDKFVDPNENGPAGNFGIGSVAAEDHGGNFLKFGSALLHGYWDENAVKSAIHKVHGRTAEGFVRDCAADTSVNFQTPGDVDTWPKQWATEILPLAKKAHEGFELGARHTVHDFFGTHLQWPMIFADAASDHEYRNFARDTTADELNKAGHRLAAILKAIWP
jgi:hypothetical protein